MDPPSLTVKVAFRGVGAVSANRHQHLNFLPIRAREAIEAKMEISDKFGHGNCVILRDSAIPTNSRFAVNALIAADFGGIRAKSRKCAKRFRVQRACRREIASLGIRKSRTTTDKKPNCSRFCSRFGCSRSCFDLNTLVKQALERVKGIELSFRACVPPIFRLPPGAP